jgi:transposase
VPATQEPTARAVLTALNTLAQRHQFLARQAAALAEQIRDLARRQSAPDVAARGRPESAAELLITAGGNPDRLRSEAAHAVHRPPGAR